MPLIVFVVLIFLVELQFELEFQLLVRAAQLPVLDFAVQLCVPVPPVDWVPLPLLPMPVAAPPQAGLFVETQIPPLLHPISP